MPSKEPEWDSFLRGMNNAAAFLSGVPPILFVNKVEIGNGQITGGMQRPRGGYVIQGDTRRKSNNTSYWAIEQKKGKETAHKREKKAAEADKAKAKWKKAKAAEAKQKCEADQAKAAEAEWATKCAKVSDFLAAEEAAKNNTEAEAHSIKYYPLRGMVIPNSVRECQKKNLDLLFKVSWIICLNKHWSTQRQHRMWIQGYL